MSTTETCPKCGGSGNIPHFSHIDGGLCYMCHGAGVVAASAVYDGPAPTYLASTGVETADGRLQFNTYHDAAVFVSGRRGNGHAYVRVDLPHEGTYYRYNGQLTLSQCQTLVHRINAQENLSIDPSMWTVGYY